MKHTIAFLISIIAVTTMYAGVSASQGNRHITLKVSPYVASYLRHGLWSLRMRWICKYKVRINIISDMSVGMIDVAYLDKRGKSLLKEE